MSLETTWFALCRLFEVCHFSVTFKTDTILFAFYIITSIMMTAVSSALYCLPPFLGGPGAVSRGGAR